MASAHIVQDLQFEVDFASEDQAFEAQERVSAFAHGPALRIVEEVFDESLASLGGAGLLRLEQLEIDLGMVDPSELESQWERRLREQLQQALADLRPQATAEAGDGAARAAAAGIQGAPERAQAVHWGTPRQADLEALLHYLQRGVLPWHAAAGTDPAQLAQRVWLHDAAPLAARLREGPGLEVVARRMARQLPAAWCAELAHTLLAQAPQPAAAVPPWPRTAEAAERRLLRALRHAADQGRPSEGPAPPQPSAELRALQRRLKALLVDDAPTLSDDDLAELLPLWQRLHRDDREGLRLTLRNLGRLARVRRRIARQWPEPLLRQLPGLWLNDDEARSALAAVQVVPAGNGAGMRRRRWEALLRHLWVGGGVERSDGQALAGAQPAEPSAQDIGPPGRALLAQPGRATLSLALPGTPQPELPFDAQPEPPPESRFDSPSDATDAPAAEPAVESPPQALDDASPTSTPSAQWRALLSNPDAQARRRGLRAAASSGLRQRWLATGTTRSDLDTALVWWLPEPQAGALAALAFDPLPAAWEVRGRPVPDAALLCQWALQSICELADSDLSARAIVARWWHALALHLQWPPQHLLESLHGPGGEAGEQARRVAWARWLPQPRPEVALERQRLRLSAALAGGLDTTLAQDWQALHEQDPDGLRALLLHAGGASEARHRLAAKFSRSTWRQLLGLFLADADAALVDETLEMLAPQSLPGTDASMAPTAAAASLVALRVLALDLALQGPGPESGQLVQALLRQQAQALGETPARLMQWVAARSPSPALLAALARLDAGAAEAPAGAASPRSLSPTPGPEATPAMAGAFVAALQRADRAALHAAWSSLFAQGEQGAQGPQALRDALRHIVDDAGWRASLAGQLDDGGWLQLLGLYLPAHDVRELSEVQQALGAELRTVGAAGEHRALLREQVLAALCWLPGASAATVAAHLLEQAATWAALPMPVLARRLSRAGRDLFSDWAADLALLDIAGPARGVARQVGVPERLTADQGPPAARARGNAEAVSRIVAALRASGPSGSLGLAERTLLLALTDQPGWVAREAIARELESAQAARRMADAMGPGELLRVLAWLRPRDAAPLQQTWPTLLELGPQGGARAWPLVARTVLRELMEEDRPLQPQALLRRAAQALQRRNMPPGTPREVAQPPPQRDAAAAWLLGPPDEPLFVTNAGIVLVTPYLQRLFGLLGLVLHKSFVDTAAAERAVALIQHAVTGQAAAPETLLPLNKLLCGLPLDAPVLREVELEPAEREAVDGMLGAVIGHWTALGQTSLAGLRQSFLQREGRLEHKEEAWQLEVPNQTFDMLIDRLPWGFATIRFPWMPEVLHVQWR